MHYLTPIIEGKGLADAPLSDFISKMATVEDASTMAVDIELARLPSQTKVVILKYD